VYLRKHSVKVFCIYEVYLLFFLLMLLLLTMNLSENLLNEVWLNLELCLFFYLLELVKI